MKITDLEDGLNEIKLAVSNIEEKETKTRKFYSVVTLMDGEQSIEAKMWTEKDLLRFMPGDVINCRIEKQYYQRIENLPDGTKQSVMIDVRGQNVSDEALGALYDDIMRRTNNGVEILFKMD